MDQVDVIHKFVQKYSDVFELVTTAQGKVNTAIYNTQDIIIKVTSLGRTTFDLKIDTVYTVSK